MDKSLEQLQVEVSKILKEESSCPMATRRAHETQKIRALHKGDGKRYFGNSGRFRFYEKFHTQLTREERRKSRKRAHKLPPLEKTIELSERLVQQMDTSGTSSPTTWLDQNGGSNAQIWDEFQVKDDIECEEQQEEAFLENPELGDREDYDEDEDEDEDEGDESEDGGEGSSDGASLRNSTSNTTDDLADLRRSSSQSTIGRRKSSASMLRSWRSQSSLDPKRGSTTTTFRPVKSPIARENELLSPRAAYLAFCETEVAEDGTITRYGVDPEPLVIRKAKTSAMVFRHYGVGDEVASALASSLKRMTGITRLDLKDNMLTCRVIPKICALVQENQEIKQ